MKFTLILVLIFYALNVESQDSISTTSATKNFDSRNSLPVKDSSINVSYTKRSNYSGNALTDSLAKKVLYDYFVKKGCLIADNLPEKLTKNDRNKLCFKYDTLYFVDLNNNNYADAIIEYWLFPPTSSSHCFQPHKALMVDQDNGYQLINEDFISDDFIIDHVFSDKTRIVISGNEYNCISNQILNRYNLIIKK